jgi:uncharacterized protein (UPF0303 family)
MDEDRELLRLIAEQEEELQFPSFSNETALQVGLALLQAAQRNTKPVTIDITRNGQQLFHYAMSGTSIDNDEWIRRKNNVVNRFGHSSLYIGTLLKDTGKTLEEKYLISSQEYAAHGGAFPLIVREVGVIGTITVSGLPQIEDHELVVSTLRTLLGRHRSTVE